MEILMAVVERWKSQALVLEEYGADKEAKALRKCASEMEAALLEQQLQELTLDEATRKSGYSYSALQQLVAQGKVPNAGTKNKPRIRRCDLPMKPGRRSLKLVPGESDLADQVLAAG
jgi:uncharacterized protein (DUF2126 family)